MTVSPLDQDLYPRTTGRGPSTSPLPSRRRARSAVRAAKERGPTAWMRLSASLRARSEASRATAAAGSTVSRLRSRSSRRRRPSPSNAAAVVCANRRCAGWQGGGTGKCSSVERRRVELVDAVAPQQQFGHAGRVAEQIARERLEQVPPRTTPSTPGLRPGTRMFGAKRRAIFVLKESSTTPRHRPRITVR